MTGVIGLVAAPTLLRNQSLYGGGVGEEDDDDDQAMATSTQTTTMMRSGSDGLLLPLPSAPQRQGLGSGLGHLSLSLSGTGHAHFSSSSSSSSSSLLREGQGNEDISPPVMERQESSMSQFYRSVGAELAGGRDELLRFPSMSASSGSFLGSPRANSFMGGINGSLERDVQYILAITDYVTNVGVLGMPAFNQSKKLIGFYRSEQGADKVTRTVFKTVPVTVTQSDRDDASELLENAVNDMNNSSHSSSSSSSSSSRSSDVSIRRQGPLFVLSEWQNNLEEMKDDAMICYMIKEDEVNADREVEQQRIADGVYVDEEDGDDDDDGDGDEMAR